MVVGLTVGAAVGVAVVDPVGEPVVGDALARATVGVCANVLGRTACQSVVERALGPISANPHWSVP